MSSPRRHGKRRSLVVSCGRGQARKKEEVLPLFWKGERRNCKKKRKGRRRQSHQRGRGMVSVRGGWEDLAPKKGLSSDDCEKNVVKRGQIQAKEERVIKGTQTANFSKAAQAYCFPKVREQLALQATSFKETANTSKSIPEDCTRPGSRGGGCQLAK